MKLLSTIIFLISTNLLFAQDTIKNNFPTYFISQIEIRYELIDLGKIKTAPRHFGNQFPFDLPQKMKPFSPDELPPYFGLQLSEEDIFKYQSYFEIEFMEHFFLAEKSIQYLAEKNHYTPTRWILTTNYDKKESANFYQSFSNQHASAWKTNGSMNSIFYQKEGFFRSVFELNLKKGSQGLHLNFSFINNLFYQHESYSAVLAGNRSHIFFPKKYHEKRNNRLGHSTEFQNQIFRGISLYPKLFLSPLKNTYLKMESDLHSLYMNKDNVVRQNFSTIGIGVQPLDETFIFVEYTNRQIAPGNYPIFSTQNEKPYFSIYANRILKLRMFKQ